MTVFSRTMAVILMLLLGSSRAAKADPPDPDPWWGRDKALHFSASAAIAAGGYAFGALAFEPHDDLARPLCIGAGLALGAGAAKETLDLAGLGDPSLRDLTWDVVGTAVGLLVSLSLHVLVRSASAPAAR